MAGNTKRALRWCQRRRVLYLLIGAAAIAAAFWFDHTETLQSATGFWGELLSNRVVFAVTCVAIVFAAGYVVYSVIHNVSRGLPLREMAGARVADKVSGGTDLLRTDYSKVRDERDELLKRLATANGTIDELRRSLSKVAQQTENLTQQLNPVLPGMGSGIVSPEERGGSGND